MGAGRERAALTYPRGVSADVVITVLASGLFTGALARLAVPGPDPMPLWLTVAIGLTGSIVGAVVARSLFDDSAAVTSIGSLVVAVSLVVAYRRFVQRRPVWGPEALRFPRRGLGVEQARARLEKLGVDPDRVGRPGVVPVRPEPSTAAPPPSGPEDAENHLLALLSELHREGVLDDAEYAAKRELVASRQRPSAT